MRLATEPLRVAVPISQPDRREHHAESHERHRRLREEKGAVAHA